MQVSVPSSVLLYGYLSILTSMYLLCIIMFIPRFVSCRCIIFDYICLRGYQKEGVDIATVKPSGVAVWCCFAFDQGGEGVNASRFGKVR